jgi:hypothetical protein
MKQILTILIATILLFSSCEDKPIVYHNYEITYWDNSKDTLYKITTVGLYQSLEPFEGCVHYQPISEKYKIICYVKSIKLIK